MGSVAFALADGLSLPVVRAVPVPPASFYGNVTVADSPAAGGIVIEARIDGVDYALRPGKPRQPSDDRHWRDVRPSLQRLPGLGRRRFDSRNRRRGHGRYHIVLRGRVGRRVGHLPEWDRDRAQPFRVIRFTSTTATPASGATATTTATTAAAAYYLPDADAHAGRGADTDTGGRDRGRSY